MNGLGAATVVAPLVVALALSSSATPTPPGRKGLVAFVTHTYSGLVGNGIAVVGPDGRGLRKLTHNPRDRAPGWSPDGEWLAFERAGGIYAIKAGGTGLRRLTSRRSTVHEPAWSPDGRHLVKILILFHYIILQMEAAFFTRQLLIIILPSSIYSVMISRVNMLP